jgi:hypothetical protein
MVRGGMRIVEVLTVSLIDIQDRKVILRHANLATTQR